MRSRPYVSDGGGDSVHISALLGHIISGVIVVITYVATSVTWRRRPGMHRATQLLPVVVEPPACSISSAGATPTVNAMRSLYTQSRDQTGARTIATRRE